MSLRTTGANENVKAANPTDDIWDYSNGDVIAMSVWIYFTSVSAGGLQSIMGRRAGVDCPYFLRGHGDEVEFYFNDGTIFHQYETSGVNLTADAWHHVSLSYEYGDGSSIEIYVDGTKATGSWTSGDGDASAPASDRDFVTGTQSTGTQPINDGSVEAPVLYKNPGIDAAALSELRNSPFVYKKGMVFAGAYNNLVSILDLSGNGNDGAVATGMDLGVHGEPPVDPVNFFEIVDEGTSVVATNQILFS